MKLGLILLMGLFLIGMAGADSGQITFRPGAGIGMDPTTPGDVEMWGGNVNNATYVNTTYISGFTIDGDLNTATHDVSGDAVVRPATITISSDGTDIVAVWRNGTILSKSSDFDIVMEAVIAVVVDKYSLHIIGKDDGSRYEIDSNHTFYNINELYIDASSAHFLVASEITGFEFNDVDYSTVKFGTIRGTSYTGIGIMLNDTDLLSVTVNQIDLFDKGFAIIEGSAQNSLDTDIWFQYIALCNDGLYIETYDMQGLRVNGNFINHCNNCSVCIHGMDSVAFNWNVINILAVEGAGTATYGVFMDGGGYGNKMKFPGFFGGHTIEFYDDMGGCEFELPEHGTVQYLETTPNPTSVVTGSTGGARQIIGNMELIGNAWGGYEKSYIYVINSQNCSDLTLDNCTIADNGNGTFRVTATGTSPKISLSDISFSGKLARYVYIKAKHVSGTVVSSARPFYYTTGGHGSSASYYKSFISPISYTSFRTTRLDMADLTAGGTDWTDNNILGVRYDIGGDGTTVLDIAYIAFVCEEAPGLTNVL